MIKLNRRIFLRGVGGAVVAAPFLGSLVERSARAQPVTRAKRTILMFTHYGCITNKWFPAKLDGELTAADLEPTSLAPLAPFASKLLLPRGLRTMNEFTVNNRGPGTGRGQANDTHTQVVGSLFTCQPVTPNSDDWTDFGPPKFDAKPIGPSLDHVIARQLSADGTPLLMNTAGQLNERPQSAISYSAREQLFPAVSVVDAFSKLTGLFQPGPMNADTWAIAKGKVLADVVQDDLKRLMSKDLSRADKYKLEGWIELANVVSNLLPNVQCSAETAAALGASGTPAGRVEGDGGDALTRKVSDSMDNADLYSAVAALTALCEASPAIVLKYPNAFLFTGLGIDNESANLSHRLDNAGMTGPCLEGAIEKILKIDGYYAQKFAKLVGYLDSLPEDDGTVLDNTVAVWMSECSDGAAHNLNNAPIVQAGSGGGYFKTGRIVHLDPSSGATAEQMLGRSLSQCVEGTPQDIDGLGQVTGTEARFGNAPINKYYCNIMNAMGLKADALGYPAVNGPAGEVTHFGYSDKTEDFCGGEGAIPDAKIHNPGEYTELRA